MNARDIKLITVSREFGAGGGEFAAQLGTMLGWPVLDQDLVHRVAERLRLDDHVVGHFDEHPPSLLARIATVLIMPQPDIYSFPPPGDTPNHDVIAAATTQVIKDAGDSVPLIVVGHGAQCIFGTRTDALHVRFVAPVATRIARVAERMRVDHAFAARLVQRADMDREAYVKRYFHGEWRNPLMYDVQVNTQRVSLPAAVKLVATLVESAREPSHA
jgi:cytidylate kinase